MVLLDVNSDWSLLSISISNRTQLLKTAPKIKLALLMILLPRNIDQKQTKICQDDEKIKILVIFLFLPLIPGHNSEILGYLKHILFRRFAVYLQLFLP